MAPGEKDFAALPVQPPVSPMLAKPASQMPEGGFIYEPKWDGFRCIVFKNGNHVELGSRNEKPLTRYFPELVEAVLAELPDRCVLDGEIILSADDNLDFDALQQRIHPAQSRVQLLAEETPVSFVAFDLLAEGDRSFMDEPFGTRRDALAAMLKGGGSSVRLTPATRDMTLAKRWFVEFEGAGLDGLIAKSEELKYQPDKRVMVKIKHERTADCVVAGFRWHKSGPIVGSMLLGLYDDHDVLHHVGITASFTMARRKELVDELAPYRLGAGDDHPWMGAFAESDHNRRPGGGSRWNAGKDLSFEALRPELVCEVAYDHLQGDRFRHATTFRRWRPDREPTSCSYGQLETTAPHKLKDIFTQ